MSLKLFDGYSRPDPAQAIAAGYQGAMVYLGGAHEKDLTAAEVSKARDGGFLLGLSFEQDTNDLDRGYGQGIADAERALADCRAAGLRADELRSCTIYHAHDEGNMWSSRCNSYLDALEIEYRPLGIGVGVYGGYDAIVEAVGYYERTHRRHLWRWQTFAWSASRVYPGLDVYQGHQANIAGHTVDLDWAYTHAGLFPAWRQPKEQTVDQQMADGFAQRWNELKADHEKDNPKVELGAGVHQEIGHGDTHAVGRRMAESAFATLLAHETHPGT